MKRSEMVMNRLKRLDGATMLAVAVVAAMPVFAAAAGVTETWSTGRPEGWVSYDLVNEKTVSRLSVREGELALAFPTQTTKTPPEHYLIRADEDASGGSFAGDYQAAGVQAVSFRIFLPRAVEPTLRLFNRQNDRVWRYRVSGLATGQWVTVTVPVAPETLHNLGGVQGWSAFRDDIRNLEWIGVAIERNSSMAAQTYLLDDFKLIGPGPEFAAWMERFPDPGDGPEGAHPLPGGDLDGDGESNVNEWIAGTSAGDSQEFFEVKLATVTPGAGNPLRWKSVEGRRYVVLRSRDLSLGFEPIAGPLAATPPENTFEDTSLNDSDPVFYRLQVMLE